MRSRLTRRSHPQADALQELPLAGFAVPERPLSKTQALPLAIDAFNMDDDANPAAAWLSELHRLGSGPAPPLAAVGRPPGRGPGGRPPSCDNKVIACIFLKSILPEKPLICLDVSTTAFRRRRRPASASALRSSLAACSRSHLLANAQDIAPGANTCAVHAALGAAYLGAAVSTKTLRRRVPQLMPTAVVKGSLQHMSWSDLETGINNPHHAQLRRIRSLAQHGTGAFDLVAVSAAILASLPQGRRLPAGAGALRPPVARAPRAKAPTPKIKIKLRIKPAAPGDAPALPAATAVLPVLPLLGPAPKPQAAPALLRLTPRAPKRRASGGADGTSEEAPHAPARATRARRGAGPTAVAAPPVPAAALGPWGLDAALVRSGQGSFWSGFQLPSAARLDPVWAAPGSATDLEAILGLAPGPGGLMSSQEEEERQLTAELEGKLCFPAMDMTMPSAAGLEWLFGAASPLAESDAE
jgi:hypothetical protein